ncbi:uncharacterized protein LOC123561754 [Mercenaria mercenaria]|uniref:uncharacterized protein LOC123561754 n=1 Tax=Mercenaria mercenaria TaxID=6596 RepID=UPI00234E73DD|nr:uncharacterized protein LOC123561754 [Mercenaria mercenaria]XP_053408918.1 uncharacterized protein LOC123561754 [Mercenaria mercenaria]
MLASVFVVSLLATGTTLVSSLNFTLSKARVIAGTTGKLSMTCQVTEYDVELFYNLQIRRETNTGWQTIAHAEAVGTGVPALHKDIVNDKDFFVCGILDKDNPLNSNLTVEMNIEKMTYDDARVYTCEMTYKSNDSGTTVFENINATLLIEEADNKTEGQADNKPQSFKCDNGSSSATIGAVLGVTNILTVVYAAYLTVVIRRSRTRSFDDGNLCHRRREPEPTATVAKQGLAVDKQTYSVNDDEDTYDLS